MPEAITFDLESFPLGSKGSLVINLAMLASRTPIEIPLFIFRGAQEGPVVLLMAGMHGDEVNGTEIIRRLINENLISLEKGAVIALPLLNIYGFINFARYVPDGKDVNRSFPGTSLGSLASRMAHFVTHQVLPKIDYGIDFHTGGGMIYNYPQIRCVFDNPLNLELANAFHPPMIINASLREKSLREQATKAGKTILVYEAGESMRFDEYSIEEGINGTLRFLSHLGLISPIASVPAKKPILIHQDNWIRALQSGFFHPTTKPGDPLHKGQLIGYLSDPDGSDKDDVFSPYEGYVISVNHMPVVNVGDALVHIGKSV